MIATSLVLCSALLGQMRPLDITPNPSGFQGGSDTTNGRGRPAVIDDGGIPPRDNLGRGVQPQPPLTRQEIGGAPSRDGGSGYQNNTNAPEVLLVSEALRAPPESRLTGRRLALVDALSHATSRAQKLDITRAYWKLALMTADHYFAVDENLQIENVSDPTGDRLATTLLRAARQSTKGMREESLVNAQLAQTDLAKLINQSPQDQLPLTGDLPFVGKYRTEFARIFASRAAPARLRALDQILPGRHDVIQKRAYAVINAVEAQAEAEKSFMAGTGSAAQAAGLVVLCRNEVRKQRKMFLEAVREYNFDIAEYALNVTESTQMRDEMVVGMLIRSPLPSAGNVKPSVGQPTRTTFVESGDVTPASANVDTDRPTAKQSVAQSEPAATKTPREPAKLDVSSMPSVMRPARPEEERMAPISQAELSSVPRNRDNPGPWSAAEDQLSARGTVRGESQPRGENTFRNEIPATNDSSRGLPDNRTHRGAPATLNAEDPLGSGPTSLPAANTLSPRASSSSELSPNMQPDPFAQRMPGGSRQSIKVRAAE